MKVICLLFLAISLGRLSLISAGGINYDLQCVEVYISVVFLFLLIKSWKKGLSLTFNKNYYFLWFLCFIYSIITYFWSDQGTTALSGSLIVFFGLISLFLSDYYLRDNPEIFVTANRLLIISVFIQLIISMVSVFHSFHLSFYALKDYSSTRLGNSNYIAFFFSFGLLYEMISREKKWFVFFLINAFGLILTLSRGAILSVAICLIVYFIVILANRKIKKIKSLMIFVVLGALFLYFINFTNAGIQLWFGLQYGIHASSVGTRQVLWSQAIQQINEQPFGNGVIWRNDPHDIVLKSFRDLGILFGAIFLLMIFYPTSYILRFKLFTTSRKSVAILIAYLSVMIHSLIEIFYLTSTSIIWVVMVLTYLSVTLKNEKKVKNTIKNSKQQIVEKAS